MIRINLLPNYYQFLYQINEHVLQNTAVVSVGQGGYGSQEVAISQAALTNIKGGGLACKELEVGVGCVKT